MNKPVCRVGDSVSGICHGPGNDHPRNFTGTWVTGSSTSTADGIPIIRVGDTGNTDCGHHFVAATGSLMSTDQGLPIHRVGDGISVIEGGSGASVTGSDTVTSE